MPTELTRSYAPNTHIVLSRAISRAIRRKHIAQVMHLQTADERWRWRQDHYDRELQTLRSVQHFLQGDETRHILSRIVGAAP